MYNVLNSEIYKTRNRKSIKISAIICLVIGIIMGSVIVVYGDKIGANLGGFNYIPETLIPNFTFLMIFIYIIPAMLITSEFKDNTMKNPLFVGTSRTKLLISKFIVMFLLIMVLILVISVPPAIIVLIANGWGAASFTFTQIGIIFSAIFKLWLYLCAYASVFALIGVMMRNIIGSIAIAYTLNILEGMLSILSGAFSKFAWIEKILLTTKNEYIMKLDMPIKDVFGITAFLCGVILITGALSWMHFKNQEIKS